MNILSDKLTALCDFLKTRCQPPPWRGIQVFEVSSNVDDRGRIRVSHNDLFAPEDYEVRFKELSERRLPWINLSCFGMHNGFLMVGIEVARSTNSTVPHTSVNYAGPPAIVLQREWDATEVLAIE